jgi:hypothetical protein
VYDVGVTLACYLMALEAVEPTSDEQPLWLPGVAGPSKRMAPKPPVTRKSRVIPLAREQAADRVRPRSKKSR